MSPPGVRARLKNERRHKGGAMAEQIVVRPSAAEQFEKVMERGRVLFFSAPSGFGKTVLADALLAGRSALRLSAGEPDFALPSAEGDWKLLLLDDLQLLQEDAQWQALCALIRDGADRRFLLLSRGAPPACLRAFQYTGLMTVLDADALTFDR